MNKMNMAAMAENLHIGLPGLKGILRKSVSPAGGHFDYWLKAESLIRSSPYSWVTSHKNWRDPISILLSC